MTKNKNIVLVMVYFIASSSQIGEKSNLYPRPILKMCGNSTFLILQIEKIKKTIKLKRLRIKNKIETYICLLVKFKVLKKRFVFKVWPNLIQFQNDD